MNLRSSFLLSAALLSPQVFADKYQIDSAHSSVEFKIRHLASKVRGHFEKFTGEIEFPAAKAKDSQFTFSIDAASVNTANEDRDKHLKGSDFFDTEKFKEISFTSNKVEANGKEGLKIYGDLSIKGKKCPVMIDAKYTGELKDPWGNTKAGFEGSLSVNRLAWDLAWNKPLVGDKVDATIGMKDSCDLNKKIKSDKNGAGLVLGTIVDIELQIEAENLTKKPAAPAKP